jgi:hypothetical protein
MAEEAKAIAISYRHSAKAQSFAGTKQPAQRQSEREFYEGMAQSNESRSKGYSRMVAESLEQTY